MSEVPRAPAPGRVDSAWRFFVSLRLTIWVLIALAAACVLGTFVSPSPVAIDDFRARFGAGAAFELARALELNDVFHAWWFSLLLWLLAMNLAACSLERLPKALRLVLHPERRLDERVLASARHLARLKPLGTPREERARLAGLLSARGYRVARPDGEEGRLLFAERGRPTRFGVYLVHLALLVVLAGALAGRVAGWEGRISVAERRGSFNFVFVQAQGGQVFRKPLGFEVRIGDFRMEEAAGRRVYETEFAWDREGSEERGTVTTRRPFEGGAFTLRQVGYERETALDEAVLALAEAGGPAQEARVAEGEAVETEDGTLFHVLEIRQDGGEARARLVRQEGEDLAEFWLSTADAGAGRGGPGEPFGLALKGVEPAYFTTLKLEYAPGGAWVVMGSVALFLGLLLTFYSSHRRIWVRVEDAEVVLAGSAHKNHLGFEHEFNALVERARRQA